MISKKKALQLKMNRNLLFFIIHRLLKCGTPKKCCSKFLNTPLFRAIKLASVGGSNQFKPSTSLI